MKNQEQQQLSKQVFIEEWDWNAEERLFITELSDDRFQQLKQNIQKAATYNSLFTITKYAIFAAFAAVYLVRYFNYHSLSLVFQGMILLIGIVSIYSFVTLRKVENNPDYYKLFLEETE